MEAHLQMLDDANRKTGIIHNELQTENRELKEKLKKRDDEYEELMKKYQDLKMVIGNAVDGAKASLANIPKLSPPPRRRHSEPVSSPHVSTDEIRNTKSTFFLMNNYSKKF